MWYCSSLVSCFFFFFVTPCLTSKQIPLIGLFTSDKYDNTTNRSSSMIIDYTLHHLKSIQNFTTELSIQRSSADVPCDMAVGTKMIFDLIDRRPRPLAIFSGSCQTVASAIAETAGIFDMTIVGPMHFLSFPSSLLCFRSSIRKQALYSPTETNIHPWFERFPGIRRTISVRDAHLRALRSKPGDFLYLARKLLLKKYHWQRFGILYQYERQYTMVSSVHASLKIDFYGNSVVACHPIQWSTQRR